MAFDESLGLNEHGARAAAGRVIDAPEEAAKTWPQCAEPVKAAAKICRFCRYEFPAEPPPVTHGG
jgi:hypothetical protein